MATSRLRASHAFQYCRDRTRSTMTTARTATSPVRPSQGLAGSGGSPRRPATSAAFVSAPPSPVRGGAELELRAVVGSPVGQFGAVPGDDLPDPQRGWRPEQVV